MGHYATREALKAFKPHSKSWVKKVDAMPDHQVVAVYFRMFNEETGKTNEPRKTR